MKKYFMMAMVCALAFTAVSCGNGDNKKDKKNRCGRCTKCVTHIIN